MAQRMYRMNNEIQGNFYSRLSRQKTTHNCTHLTKRSNPTTSPSPHFLLKVIQFRAVLKKDDEKWNTGITNTRRKSILKAKKWSLDLRWQSHSRDEEDGKSWRDQWQTKRLQWRPCLLFDSHHCYHWYQTNMATVICRGFGSEENGFKAVNGFCFGMILSVLFFQRHTQCSDLFSPHTGT